MSRSSGCRSARAGRIAGGRCYGYALKRQSDASGRPYTIAVIDEKQAEIVRRLFREYLEGSGLVRLAKRLNDEGITKPVEGKRGTGSWSPGCIRDMLRNQRYRGLYIHGRIKRVRRGGKRIAMIAPAEEVITVEIPEWRIIDDDLWFAVEEKISERARPDRKAPGPGVRHPISGVGRCLCGGAIGAHHSKTTGGESMKVYACDWHNKRGDKVCKVKVRQSMEAVERAVIDYLNEVVLTDAVADQIVGEIRGELQRQFSAAKQDTSVIDDELKRMRSEQRNLAAAVATGGDAIPELVAELRKRNERIRLLESDLAAAKRTPQMACEMLEKASSAVREQLSRFRDSLAESREDVREVFHEVFQEGLQFVEEVDEKGRRVWAIVGWATLSGFTLHRDPSVTRTRGLLFRKQLLYPAELWGRVTLQA